MSDLKRDKTSDAGAAVETRYRVGRLSGESVRPVRRGELSRGDAVVLRAGDHVPRPCRVVAGRAGVRLYSRSGTTPIERVSAGAMLPTGTEVVSGSLVVEIEGSGRAHTGDEDSPTESEMDIESNEAEHDRSALKLAATMLGSAVGVAALALLGGGSVLTVGIAGAFCGLMAFGRA